MNRVTGALRLLKSMVRLSKRVDIPAMQRSFGAPARGRVLQIVVKDAGPLAVTFRVTPDGIELLHGYATRFHFDVFGHPQNDNGGRVPDIVAYVDLATLDGLAAGTLDPYDAYFFGKVQAYGDKATNSMLQLVSRWAEVSRLIQSEIRRK